MSYNDEYGPRMDIPDAYKVSRTLSNRITGLKQALKKIKEICDNRKLEHREALYDIKQILNDMDK